MKNDIILNINHYGPAYVAPNRIKNKRNIIIYIISPETQVTTKTQLIKTYNAFD